MKKQVVVIHGGETFNTYAGYLSYLENLNIDFDRLQRVKWRDRLPEKLGPDFNVIRLEMPNRLNAKYLEWKIYFEKIIPFLESEVILIGSSLGGIFLAKYLSENDFPKRIIATFLIAPPYDDSDSEYSLADFVLQDNLEKISEQSGIVRIYHSKDDPVVRFSDLDKYKKALPNAETKIFEDRGHFFQEEFPELVEDIKHAAQ